MMRRQQSGPILRPSAAPPGRGRAAGFPVWKTVTLGTHESVGGLREALNTAGFGIGDLAREALNRLALTARPRTPLDLAVVSGSKLGLTAQDTSLAEICSRAAAHGLMLCPAEVAPQLRLQYSDQPPGEFSSHRHGAYRDKPWRRGIRRWQWRPRAPADRCGWTASPRGFTNGPVRVRALRTGGRFSELTLRRPDDRDCKGGPDDRSQIAAPTYDTP